MIPPNSAGCTLTFRGQWKGGLTKSQRLPVTWADGESAKIRKLERGALKTIEHNPYISQAGA